MTVKYTVVERGNPSDASAPKKFYPSISSSGRKSMRQLSGRIAEISTVSSTDTMAVIEAFLSVIPQELAAGNIVELGDFGSFWLKTTAEGAETAEAVRASQIKTVLPRFMPGKEFKKVLNTVEFSKAANTTPPPAEPTP
jgi:predicted histone-like DNA-binding protein